MDEPLRFFLNLKVFCFVFLFLLRKVICAFAFQSCMSTLVVIKITKMKMTRHYLMTWVESHLLWNVIGLRNYVATQLLVSSLQTNAFRTRKLFRDTTAMEYRQIVITKRWEESLKATFSKSSVSKPFSFIFRDYVNETAGLV